jgi:hypothetical protein
MVWHRRTRTLATIAGSMIVLLSAPQPAAAEVIARDEASAAGLAQTSESVASLPVDLDRDGDVDVVWNRQSAGTTQLFYNDGTGRFTERYAGLLPAHRDRHQCASADVDRDGLPDIYCTLGAAHGTRIKANELWMQQPTGGFVNEAAAYGVVDAYGRGRTATFLDVNDDGWRDLFVVNYYPRPDGHPTQNRLFLNEGGTAFRSAPEYGLDEQVGGLPTTPGCVQAVDYDGDGYEDVLDCADKGLRLYRYVAATERFVNVAGSLGISAKAQDAELADLNGDGVLDLATVARSSLRIRYGNGVGGFPRVVFSMKLTAGRALGLGESNRDDRLDIYVVRSQQDPSLPNPSDLMLLSTPTGWTQVSIPQTSAGCGATVSVLDFDGNGLDDYLVSNGARGVAGPTQLIAFHEPG